MNEQLMVYKMSVTKINNVQKRAKAPLLQDKRKVNFKQKANPKNKQNQKKKVIVTPLTEKQEKAANILFKGETFEDSLLKPILWNRKGEKKLTGVETEKGKKKKKKRHKLRKKKRNMQVINKEEA